VAGAKTGRGAADRDAGLQGEIDQRVGGGFGGDGKGMRLEVGLGGRRGDPERQSTGAQPEP